MKGKNCDICGRNTLEFACIPKHIIGDVNNLNQIRDAEKIPMCENCFENLKRSEGMNQRERIIKRTCCMCKEKDVQVRQAYDRLLSDWKDGEIPICVDCRKQRRILNE